MDGDQVLVELQAQALIEDAVIVVMSGIDRVIPNARARGVLGTLRKPIAPERLLEVLDRHCSKGHGQ